MKVKTFNLFDDDTRSQLKVTHDLSDKDLNMFQLSAFEALREIVNRESDQGNATRLSLLFSINKTEPDAEIIDDIISGTVSRLYRKIDLPILLIEKISKRTIESALSMIQLNYKCNSLSKLLRYFNYSQLNKLNYNYNFN